MDEYRVQLARVTGTIAAPVEDIWDVLTDFAHPQRLAPTIAHCSMSGEGVGAIRTVQSSRGLTIHERLLECDRATGCFRYEVLDSGDMPFAHITCYECTVTMTSQSDGTTDITWSSVGNADGPIEPIAEFLGALYRRANDNIRTIVAS